MENLRRVDVDGVPSPTIRSGSRQGVRIDRAARAGGFAPLQWSPPAGGGQNDRRSARVSVRSRGFTLIELLVAMAIVAIIGVMALARAHGGHQAADRRARARQRWQAIQLAMRLVVQDLAQFSRVRRATRPAKSISRACSRARMRSSPLEFSRGGWANPGGFARGTVLRVAYNGRTTSSTVCIGR